MYMSVVDNLLSVHVPAIKVTLVYDIASDGDRPVANPMSLVFAPCLDNVETGTGIATPETKTHKDVSSVSFDPYDAEVCSPLWPHYYIQTKQTHRRSSSLGLMNGVNVNTDVWSLRVNLVEAIRCSFGSSPGVVAGFLMRRNDDGYISESVQKKRMFEGKNDPPGTYAKELLLSELLSSARQSVDLGKLVSAFNVLCSVYRIALTERTRQLSNDSNNGSNGGKSKGRNNRDIAANLSEATDGTLVAMDEGSAVLAEEHSAIPGTTAPSLRRRVSMALPMASYQSVRTRCGRVVVLQRDVFKRILQPMMMDSSINDSWTYAVMFEYLRSLQRFRIPGMLHLYLYLFQ